MQSEVKQKVKSLEDAIAELKKMLIQTQAGVDDNKRQIETCVFRIDKCDQHITEIKKKLKEHCRLEDQLKSEDQEVVCHFLDMTVRQDKLKQAIGNAGR